MKTRKPTGISVWILAMVVGLFAASELRAADVEIIVNQLSNLTDTDVFTVPKGKKLVITDVIVSNSNGSESCCARIGTGGFASARTAFIAVPAGGVFEHSFVDGIAFKANEKVSVRNGASAGALDFYLRGTLK